MPKKLYHKTVLITGASNGIGNAIATHFVKKKYNVINIDILKSSQKSIHDYIFDLENINAIEKLIKDIIKKYGKIDLLINNARSGVRTNYLRETGNNWDKTFNINLRSHFFLTQSYLKNKKKINYGTIINISSVASSLVTHESASYHMSKAGIDMMTKYFSYNSVNSNSSVFSLNLGMIVQERYLKKFNSKLNKHFRENVNLYQNNASYGSEQDIISVIETLTDKKLKFLTGNIFNLTGGSTLVEQLTLLMKKNG